MIWRDVEVEANAALAAPLQSPTDPCFALAGWQHRIWA
jgi:hypothetical protein